MTEPKALQKEAQGDWCGFKGSAYHITYAVWLLLTGEAAEVAFYRGNDLLAQPPEELQPEGCGMRVPGPSVDVWIQVKAQAAAWTAKAVLEDILYTFVLNALLSQQRGRSWSVELATTSEIRRVDIAAFVGAPAEYSDLNPKLEATVQRAHREWFEYLQSMDQIHTLPTLDDIRSIALKALGEIAKSRSQSHEFLTQGIQLELTKRLYDVQTVLQAALALSGAVLDAIRTCGQPLALSVKWLQQRTGLNLRPDDLVHSNPLEACRVEVESTCQPSWAAAFCAERRDLAAAVHQFLRSDRTLFVAVGESGAGKSWFCFDLALNQLSPKVRVLLSGGDLLTPRSLADVVSSKFHHLARPHATEQEIWRLLVGASKAGDRGPLVVIFDDLPISVDAHSFCQRLEQLCREAQAEGIKLVLGARPQIWQRVWDETRLSPYLYSTARSPGPDEPRQSCRLGELTNEEQRDLLERTVRDRARIALLARQLREPRLAALRNAYLLSLFIRNVVPGGQLIETVDIDALLDEEIAHRLQQVAQYASCVIGEMRDTQEEVVRCLWDCRATGAPPADLVRAIDAKIPGLGRRVFDGLQLNDILTPTSDPRAPGGYVTYANPQLGDRLTALWLAKRFDEEGDPLGEMKSGLDDGIMVALLRGKLGKCLRDQQSALAWAERALAHDPAWLPAVAEGIAQRDADDWHTLATVTAWANRKEPYSTWNAMRGLGGMAARSARARYWIAFLYSDEYHRERFKGEIALGRAIAIAPRWVQRRVRVRLRREVVRQPSWESDYQRKAELLRSALEPLRWINDAAAAEIARSTLTWLTQHYKPRRPEAQLDIREQVYDRVDSIRGVAALHSSEQQLETILDELQEPDGEIRLRAARALVPISEKRPDAVRAVVMARAQVETSWLVLVHLVCSLHCYVDDDCDGLLALLAAPGFQSGFGNSGSVLALLAEIALQRPEEVKSALLNLPTSSANAATLNGEMNTLAWWRCAAGLSGDTCARSVLEWRSTPSYDGVEPKLRPFVARTAAIATLAEIGLDLPAISEASRGTSVYFHHLGLESGKDFLHVDLTPVIQRFSAEIVRHPRGEHLLSLLVESLQEHAKHEAHPIEVFLPRWQFRVAQLCADWLAALARRVVDPLAIVNQLPHWPALRVAREIVEVNRATPELVEYCLGICDKHAGEWSNVSSQRDSFLAALAAKNLLPNGQHLSIRGQPFHASSDAAAVDARIGTDPHIVFEALHSAVNIGNIIPFLWEWSCESRNWRAVLLGHVHRACFRDEPLTPGRAQELAGMVLDAGSGVRGSQLVGQNLEVFRALWDLAAGDDSKPPEVLVAEDFLSRSQGTALALIRDFLDRSAHGEGWLYRFLSTSEGWVEDYSQWIEYGTAVHGSGRGRVTVYLPPALRIALAIIGERLGLGDFGSRWMRERAEVRRVVGEIMPPDWTYQVIRERQLEPNETNDLKAGLMKLNAQLGKTPSHPDIWHCKGHLELLLGQWQEAHGSLTKCFQTPARVLSVERAAHYDLACVHARLGQSDACRTELTAAFDQAFRVTPNELLADPDLASVHSEEWFTRLVESIGKQAE